MEELRDAIAAAINRLEHDADNMMLSRKTKEYWYKSAMTLREYLASIQREDSIKK